MFRATVQQVITDIKKAGKGFFFPDMTPQAEKIHYYLTEAGEVMDSTGSKKVEVKEVTSYFKEFLILFFGAAWSK